MKPRVQCKACPWRKDVVPDRDIPGGYCEKKHAALERTIAKSPTDGLFSREMRMMACHESPGGGDQRKMIVCVGWLANQLGPGNNIAVRMRAASGEFPEFKLVGKQHQTFEDTLPETER